MYSIGIAARCGKAPRTDPISSVRLIRLQLREDGIKRAWQKPFFISNIMQTYSCKLHGLHDTVSSEQYITTHTCRLLSKVA